jgi:hypothetical protein
LYVPGASASVTTAEQPVRVRRQRTVRMVRVGALLGRVGMVAAG